MTMVQQQDRRGDLMVGWAEMARSAGHVFYDRLQSVLIEGGFDGFAEATCKPYYATKLGAPSVPPERYFRMHLVGYFEGMGCPDIADLRYALFPVAGRTYDRCYRWRGRAAIATFRDNTDNEWVIKLWRDDDGTSSGGGSMRGI